MSRSDILGLSHLTLTVHSFITYEFFFTCQLIRYLNGYIESSRELATEAKKSGLKVEMLRRAKEKVEKEVALLKKKLASVENENLRLREEKDRERKQNVDVEGNEGTVYCGHLSHILSKLPNVLEVVVEPHCHS